MTHNSFHVNEKGKLKVAKLFEKIKIIKWLIDAPF